MTILTAVDNGWIGLQERLSEKLYDVVRRRIARGALPPGTHLTQDRLASELGVSRIPARDALRRLALEGFLTERGTGHLVVAEIGANELKEILAIRACLEPLALELAMAQMTDRAMCDLHQLLLAMRQAAQAQAVGEYASCDRAWHFAIYAHGANARLLKLIETQWNVQPELLAVRYGSDLYQDHNEHELLLATMKSGDAAGAARLLADHIAVDLPM